MNSSAKKTFGGLLALGLAALNLCGQGAAPFGSLPLWFETGASGSFLAHGCGSEFAVTAGGAAFTLTKANGDSAVCRLQLVGTASEASIAGDQPLAGKINRFSGNQPEQWQRGRTAFARVRVEMAYPGVDMIYYASQKNLEYDFNVAAGADPSVITLRFDGAEKIAVNRQGQLVATLHAGEIIQHAPVAYQTVQGARREVSAGYKILADHTVKFALGEYDRSLPLVIDPVLAYSTYFGGNIGETAWAVAVNTNDGSVYVAGQTFSTKITNGVLFASADAVQTNFHGGKLLGDAFVARFDSTGTNLIYATYLGGNGDDAAYAITVDAAGNAFVAGATLSTNFPVKNWLPRGATNNGPLQPFVHNYPSDAFITELDPSGSSLVYSTYLGGSSAESAYGIALDDSGDACIAGFTFSTNFPVTPDAYQTNLACSNRFDNCNSFVAVVAAGGGTLKYSTYLGGTNYDIAKAIAWNHGRVFIAGYTTSTNFPLINPLPGQQFESLNGNTNTKSNKQLHGVSDAFVTAFDFTTPSPTILYSTLLGGTNNDAANGIAADAAGNAYVAGYTMSTNFPCTATNVPGLPQAFVHTNNFEKHFYLVTNSFLTKITWDGSHPAINWSAMFGQKGISVANAVALDALGNVYITGSATCTNYPVTTNNLSDYLSPTNSSKKNGSVRLNDVVVTVINNDATALLFSAYLGGRENDYGNGIAVDATGSMYVVGSTASTNFPAFNAWQSHRNGTNDMFLAKISPDEIVTLSVLQNSSQPNVRPLWTGMPASGQTGITLKWKQLPASYQVESAADLNAGDWQPVPQNPVATNGWYQLDLPATDGVRFFRLHRR